MTSSALKLETENIGRLEIDFAQAKERNHDAAFVSFLTAGYPYLLRLTKKVK